MRIWLALALVGPAEVPAAPRPAEPTLRQVQRAALRRGSLPATTARRWLPRARAAAWLPRVGVQVDLDADRGYRLDRASDAPDQLAANAGRSRGWRLDLTWDLDRLIFNPDELRAARAALDVLDHRAAMLDHVTHIYYERRALADEARHATPNEEATARAQREAHLAERTSQLETLTGLVFPP